MASPEPTRQLYQTAFLELLAALNPAQRSAVEQTEGPVMVIAGPGTGKTQVLAARIGKILLETDTQANNILCLTFTDAGSIAMRARLTQFIGPEAQRVHIYTFHAFCNAIIQENLERFGRQDLDPLTELERVDLIRQLLEGLDLEHPLRRNHADPYFYEGHLHELFQRIKREDWTVTNARAQISAYLADLPNRSEYRYQRNQGPNRKGDLKTAKLQEEQQRMTRLLAAIDLYPSYEAAKTKARRYDYADMIGWVLEAFAADPLLLRRYQEQYLYVLVDEYQDTNGAQNQVLLQLINYWDTPNIFLVGDDDQSIYEFQGARLRNLIQFYARYAPALHTVVLTENYRSPATLLAAATHLIGFNQLRILAQLPKAEFAKDLKAAGSTRHEQPRGPVLRRFPNRLHELVGLVEAFQEHHQAGVPWEQMAVLYAQHRQVRYLIPLLERHGIPYQTRRETDLLALPLIQRVIAVLEYLAVELERPYGGEQRLYQLLHFQFLRIPPNELARLSYALQRAPDRRFLRDALLDPAWLQAQCPNYVVALNHFGQTLESALRLAINAPLPVLLEQLLVQSGWLASTAQETMAPAQLEILYTFFQHTREECLRQPGLSLGQLLQRLQRMAATGIALPLLRQVEARVGVHLLTAHGAKGLEFDYVYLLDCVSDYWDARTRGGGMQFRLPDTLTFSGEEDATEARRRLFYVAMTRARRGLQLSYAAENEQGKPLQRTVFIEELVSGAKLDEVSSTVAPVAVQAAQNLLLQPAPQLEPVEDAVLDLLLEDFRLSITALNSYLYCPLAFYFEHVVRVPVLPSEAAAYGIAAHYALQRLFGQMLQGREKIFPPEQQFLEYFEAALQRQRGQISTGGYQRYLEQGRRQLRQYYQQNYGRWSKKVQVEFNIHHTELEGIPLTGVIDKIEFQDQLRVHVVDYKTGSHAPAKMRRPTPANPEGGSYWRQLVFYKILYEAYDRSSRQVESGEIAYLSPNESGQFPELLLRFTPEDGQQLRTMIRQVYSKIQDHQFFTGCGRPECNWCRLLSGENPVGTLAREEQEALDDAG